MKTLEETFNLIETLNDDAHSQAWDTWVYADELEESEDEADWEIAEDTRQSASEEQAGYFRDMYYELDEEDQEAVKHWITQDSDFKEQFAVYFGESEFIDEFESN